MDGRASKRLLNGDGKRRGDQTLFTDCSRHEAFLSEEVANRFGELPYLFKMLAAEKALSIQVHPNKQQAELGFALEEKQGIPLTAANRNYKDPNHKPELVYALTEYQAMNASAQQVKSSASSLSWRFLSCKVGG